MNYGSLFTGIGGLDLGFDRAGFSCRWQVEINEQFRRVLAKHWPSVDRSETDVRSADCKRLADVRGIIGGFPCKQTSTIAAVHNRRSGLDGADSGLWRDQHRIIETKSPVWALVENVAGVARWEAKIKSDLESIGYKVSKLVGTAAMVGAPHLRKRIFYVAHRDIAGLEIAWRRWTSSIEFEQRRAANRNAWVENIAGIRGMDDGFPSGMDRRWRIEAIGNAVCPHLAYELAGFLKSVFEI